MESDVYIDDEEEQTIVIVMTSGPSAPHRCATPFYLGALLASMDAEVHIFFTMEGVNLMRKDVPEELCAMEGGKRIIDFVRDAKRAGAILHVCRPALPGYDMEEFDLISEVDHVSSAGVLAELLLGCDKVLSF